MNKKRSIEEWFAKVKNFEKEAYKILGTHEDSRQSRVITLKSSYENLNKLKLKQDDLFRQAFTCTERECYRAAHVMAWSAFMDFLEEKIFEDNGKKINKIRPKWGCKTPEDLREIVNDFQIIDTLLPLGLCLKSTIKSLHGLLSKRNECAHPTDYYPGLNDTLGYISELLNRIKSINSKKI